MVNLKRLIIISLLLFTVSISTSFSQAENNNGYNPLSLRKVHDSYVMWKKTLWRRIDMLEKQNRPFFARNREISRIIVDAVKRRELFPYVANTNNSVDVLLDPDVFLASLFTKPIDYGCEELPLDDPFYEPCPELILTPIGMRDFSVFTIKENIYFDRIHSRMYFDIQTVTMEWAVGGSNTSPGDIPMATFKFKDLHTLFKSMPKEAIWFNEKNIAQHKNLGDAFLLRLFSGRITRFSNVDDDGLIDYYDVRNSDGRMKSYEYEQGLIEWESNLWEY